MTDLWRRKRRIDGPSGISGGRGPRAVRIGNQEWMADNLNVDTFRNGDPLPEVKYYEHWQKAGNEGKPAWCYYGNDPQNDHIYGKLYNWFAACDPRGLAPEGWHIPSDDEWQTLVEYLGGPDVACSKMKKADTTLWRLRGPDAIDTNESGFSALPGGAMLFRMGPSGIGLNASFWSSTESSRFTAWSRDLLGWVNRGEYDKGEGRSVRCVRD